jgi:hypothetical protein
VVAATGVEVALMARCWEDLQILSSAMLTHDQILFGAMLTHDQILFSAMLTHECFQAVAHGMW